jgi:hypothetical protein
MIQQYITTLRQLIIDILGDADNSNYKVSKEISDKWSAKRANAKKQNDGFLFEKRIIFYIDLEDLKLIIENNWKDFLPVLFDKKRFEVFFNEVLQFQKTQNNGQELIQSQEHLLSGIVQDLKNAITIFNNKKSQVDDYFISISKISDNLGTTWFTNHKENQQKPILKVGDDYELLIEANDPKDRKIEYQIFHFAGKLRINQESNRFQFKIDETLIGQSSMLVIKAFTKESDYINESILKINITVLPK